MTGCLDTKRGGLSVMIMVLVTGLGCGSTPQNAAFMTESVGLNKAQRSLSTKTKHHLYVVEGQRSAPTSCEHLDEHEQLGLLTRYFAHTQGSKAIVKEHCESEDLPVLPELDRGTCSAQKCWSLDTYRRGPTYFARFLAVLEVMIPLAQVEIEVLGSDVMTEEGHDSSQRDRHVFNRSLGGLFELTQHRVVHKQRLKFTLDEQTRCVAQLKTFRDAMARERTDKVRTLPSVDLSPRLSLGDIWAEHRRTADGYEVLILERHLAEGRGEGEVLEVEMLCINPHNPINPHRRFSFTTQEINRDTLRIFAYPKRELMK